MGCCGQKRQALRAGSVAAPASGPWVNVEYRSRGGLRVRGATGRAYVFSEARPIQPVHPRDARVLLRSPAFRMI
jgi:hypothetical protein